MFEHWRSIKQSVQCSVSSENCILQAALRQTDAVQCSKLNQDHCTAAICVAPAFNSFAFWLLLAQMMKLQQKCIFKPLFSYMAISTPKVQSYLALKLSPIELMY